MKRCWVIFLLLAVPVLGWATTRTYSHHVHLYFRAQSPKAGAQTLREEDVRAAPDIFESSLEPYADEIFRRIYLNGPMEPMGAESPEVNAVIDVEQLGGGVRTYLVNRQYIYDLGTRQRLPFTCNFLHRWSFVIREFDCPPPTEAEKAAGY